MPEGTGRAEGIIVVGGSAGCVESVKLILHRLAAAIFVVVHRAAPERAQRDGVRQKEHHANFSRSAGEAHGFHENPLERAASSPAVTRNSLQDIIAIQKKPKYRIFPYKISRARMIK